jgi:hypothetical protein
LVELFEWFGRELRPRFTKATASAGLVALAARGLGSISINVRITAVRNLAVEAADNGLLTPELAAGITRIKGVKSKGVRLGNWLSGRQAQTLLNAADTSTNKRRRDRAGGRPFSSTAWSSVLWPASRSYHTKVRPGTIFD